MTIPSLPSRSLPLLITPLALAVSLTLAPSAHAGPTVAADLDLGTSVKRDYLPAGDQNPEPYSPSALYVTGFRIRAGWRFDVGPVFLLPEIGGGYDVERFAFSGFPTITSSLPRVFAGGRAGLSLPLAPLLRLEPAIYGHVGDAWYQGEVRGNGLATDVGLALDLRILKLVLVGVHVGYDVVTVWESLPSGDMVNPPAPNCVQTVTGCVPQTPVSTGPFALADRWVSYGVHAGVLFW
jgi:hypothetical protein